MKTVKKEDWKTEKMPSEISSFEFNKVLSENEYASLILGFKPAQMEDKWFAFVENDKLFFHRSWTGFCIYETEIEKTENGYLLTQTKVNRNFEQYKETDLERDKELLVYLIDRILLNKKISFPNLKPIEIKIDNQNKTVEPYQYLFERMSNILKKEFEQDILEHDEGNHITLGETGFWISSDDKELTIGLGMNHRHYDFNFDSMEDAIDVFFLLLTKRKKVTDYKKGSNIFKTKVEIELENGKSLDFGTTATIPLQFWKRTESIVSYEKEYLSTEKIEKHWKELINYAQQSVKIH